MLNVLAFALSRSGKPFNARPIWLLRCSIRFICRGFPPVAFARTDNSGRPILRLHALTLIVRRRSLRLRFASSVETGCVCLHALSSFQRTDLPVVPGTPGFPASAPPAREPTVFRGTF